MSGPSRPLLSGALAAALLLGAGGIVAIRSSEVSAETTVRIPAPAIDVPATDGTATAVLAGGCFWGVQGVFQHVKGVTRAVSGYAGGDRSTARYETVGTGRTGHAEAVRIDYDPNQISYGTILQIFFSVVADPTTLNYQGPDHGPQYRTAIVPTTPEQKRVAASYIAQLNRSRAWKKPIVTRIEPMTGFYPAEAYHQDFLIRKPNHDYIRIHDLPKVAALKKSFPARYRDKPVPVKAKG
jgi:peptide-methionine (S)-S-oxide reductase